MNSYEFEVACKNELIAKLKEVYNEKIEIQELHLVWFTKALKNFKCLIIDLKENNRYYECTYNGIKKELYVDIYEKKHNFCTRKNDLKTKVVK